MLILLFLLGIYLPFCGTILAEKKAVSLHEKRRLASFPKISFNHASLQALPKALEEYCRDHLFLREYFVRLNATLRVRFMNKSPTFMVLVGTDGWYYYCGDWALHDFLGRSDKTDEATTRAWETNLSRRARWLQDMGIQYLVALAPNKESVHAEFLPDRFRHLAGTTMLAALQARMQQREAAEHFLDLTPALRRAKETGPVYHKTDSHWNSHGAYIAYREIVERIRHWYPEVAPVAEDRIIRLRDEGFRGDLPALMGLADTIAEPIERWTVQDACAVPRDSKSLAELVPGRASLPSAGCPTAAPRRVLVIADSFIEGLRDYLLETFQEVVISRELGPAELKPFIAQYHPDLVLQLQVGRYLPRALGGEQ
ncbi:MAG: hypothetical protein BWK76_12825 [Desulfobulbaceae bacterium A2]|nr:MAG: hypothetical protein BWK76_12825 [Desulfobulbaceae bacterium A2]